MTLNTIFSLGTYKVLIASSGHKLVVTVFNIVKSHGKSKLQLIFPKTVIELSPNMERLLVQIQVFLQHMNSKSRDHANHFPMQLCMLGVRGFK